MPRTAAERRQHARAIWQAAVEAVQPHRLLCPILTDRASPIRGALTAARRIMVVGAGKAGAAMSAAVEEALADLIPKMAGIVNVPAETVRPLRAIRLHAARPAGTNFPTAEGVAGAEEMLHLLARASPDDVALCLLSGGGSALLPAPVPGVSLADKLHVTRLLHRCGATIHEMNTVRKHLSRIKGGGLARAFTGRALFSFIISDVVGDPVDVIASGPTAADPSTFADALAILDKYRLRGEVPATVVDYLERGRRGEVAETLKQLPAHVSNCVIGNNRLALAAAQKQAELLGWPVVNLGSYLEGETRQVAIALAGVVRSIRADACPAPPPVCLLSGGETTVTLPPDTGLGGRNQEFVLAALSWLGPAGAAGVTLLSGGTDGEDGPTDAAGAWADADTLTQAARLGLDPASFLIRHDAYRFFDATGGLLRTGFTQTNVMDVRVILVDDLPAQPTPV
ncbi:MAG: DUF4147 domain-containing protein [Gemmataceae bacterium]|nr:DUF4147 domain-containing protein [Gemmataceae bacterium]MDW8264896.1 DUF4147 domain-containing protein [Gemmataceae bacterium]